MNCFRLSFAKLFSVIRLLYKANTAISLCLSDEIGIHGGFKIPCRKTCRFESDLRYHYLKALFLIERGFFIAEIQSLPIRCLVSKRQCWRGFQSNIRVNLLSAINHYTVRIWPLVFTPSDKTKSRFYVGF